MVENQARFEEKKVEESISPREVFPLKVFPLKEPHTYVAITKDSETGGLRYVIMEPTLSEGENEALRRIKEIFYETLDMDLNRFGSREEAEKYLRNAAKIIIQSYQIELDPGAIDKLEYYLVRDLINYGKIDPLMHDPMVEDASCDGPKTPIYVWHRQHESLPTNIVFEEEELDAFVVRLAYMVGKHISIASPILDGSLPDGSRIQLTYGKEVTRKGSTFTIRRFRADPFTVADLISLGTMTSEMAAWFWLIMEKKSNILIGGGTASGKTTTLNSLSSFIPPDDKIITIEDTAELNLPHENWISSVARVGFGPAGSSAEINQFDLLKAAMRQRPDYIIVGEVRGSEAYTLFQAMATGHGGLSSIHCDSVLAAFNRLESEPMNIPHTLLTTVNAVAMQMRVKIGDKVGRKLNHVVEVVGLDPVSKEILTNEVFRWDPKSDTFDHSGRSIILERIMERHGLSEQYLKNEMERRKIVLDWLIKTKLRFDQVGNVIRDYHNDPEKVVEKASLELNV